MAAHHSHPPISARLALLTVSDSRNRETDRSGNAARALPQPAVQQQPAADAGAQGQEQHVVGAACGAKAGFPPQGEVGVVADNHRPVLLAEAKLSDAQPSPALIKFQKAVDVPAVQLVNQAGGFRKLRNGNQIILVAPACQWLAMLP